MGYAKKSYKELVKDLYKIICSLENEMLGNSKGNTEKGGISNFIANLFLIEPDVKKNKEALRHVDNEDRYFKEEYDADFVFVTHYPSKKRPFYAMDDPSDEKFTLSFDLLFRGLEITTGGQRIHDYKMLTDKITARGMTEEGMEQYLATFKHGMPPHGGLGIGLERLTMQLLGEDNVRETTLFPRDLSRLEP